MFLTGECIGSSATFGAAPTSLDYFSVPSASDPVVPLLLNQSFLVGGARIGNGFRTAPAFQMLEIGHRAFLGFADVAGFASTSNFFGGNTGELNSVANINDVRPVTSASGTDPAIDGHVFIRGNVVEKQRKECCCVTIVTALGNLIRDAEGCGASAALHRHDHTDNAAA